MENPTEIVNCAWMAALGLVVREGVVTPVGERDQVQASIIANMTAAAKLYQAQQGADLANDPSLRADLHELIGEFQDNEDHNPVRQALLEGMALFERLADLIFLPDPPHCNIRELPRETFAGVPYFYDLRDLAEKAGYDLSSLGIQIEGETGERAVEFNRKTAPTTHSSSTETGGNALKPDPRTRGMEQQIDRMLNNH